MLEIVGRVGGDRVQVQALLSPGASPHTYEPTPRQLAALWEADLFAGHRGPLRDPAARQDLLAAAGPAGRRLLQRHRARADRRCPPRRPPRRALRPSHLARPGAGEDRGGRGARRAVPARPGRLRGARRQPGLVPRGSRGCAPAHRGDPGAVPGPHPARLPPRVRLLRAPLRARAGGGRGRRQGADAAPARPAGRAGEGRRVRPRCSSSRRSRGSSAAAVAEAVGCPLVELDPLAADLVANLERMARRHRGRAWGSRR